VSILKTEGLIKEYSGRRVVDQVNLELHKGEIVGLLGPNGAGKTTTFNMVVGITRPNGGRITLDGHDITRLPMYLRARRGLGYLAQEKSVFRKLTVEENIRAIAEIQPVSRAERNRRVENVLEELGITHLARQPAYTLSGGERRRVEIARALVCEPAFMLLDEPFSGVDPKAVEELQNVIYQMQRRGLGILITDHSVRETLTVTDRAYLIYEGKVLISGTAAELVNDPKARQYYLGERFYMDVQPDARKSFLGSLFGRREKAAAAPQRPEALAPRTEPPKPPTEWPAGAPAAAPKAEPTPVSKARPVAPTAPQPPAPTPRPKPASAPPPAAPAVKRPERVAAGAGEVQSEPHRPVVPAARPAPPPREDRSDPFEGET
jgi:lipopolysaccharide export system ATP-binding protein